MLGVVPAQQRLGANHMAGGVHLRLVVQFQIVVDQRAAHVAQQAKAPAFLPQHLRVEQGDIVPPETLGLIHRHVGIFHQDFGPLFAAIENQHADTCRSVMNHLPEHEFLPQRCKHPVGRHDRIAGRTRSGRIVQ